MVRPMPISLRLFEHWDRLARSLALAKAGSSMAARMAMMAMTTRSSIKVKPGWRAGLLVPGQWLEVGIFVATGVCTGIGSDFCLIVPLLGACRQLDKLVTR